MLKITKIMKGFNFKSKMWGSEPYVSEAIEELGPENVVQIDTASGITTLIYEDPSGPRTTCPGCGRFICPEDDFCGDCGAPLRENVCPSCGYHVRPGKKFCTKCGTSLITSAP